MQKKLNIFQGGPLSFFQKLEYENVQAWV
jgi:hypothetical protein